MECKHKNLVALNYCSDDDYGIYTEKVRTMEPEMETREDYWNQPVKSLCVCKDCGAVLVKEFMPEAPEEGHEKTGKEMLEELGYVETVPWVFVSRGYDSPTSHEINIQSNGDVKYITQDAFCGASYVMLPPEEIHALHYLLKERGL